MRATISDNLITTSNPPGSLWRHWVGAVVLGELIGFIPPAVVGALLASNNASAVVLVAGLTMAGTAEEPSSVPPRFTF